MIRHILKIIWNERKSNILVVLEFIIVFCILWFCCDYLYYIASRYFEPHGYDIEHTYLIRVDQKEEIEMTGEDKYNYAMTFIERVKNYPEIENVSFSDASIPYGWNSRMQGLVINSDSNYVNAHIFRVVPEFFDVFKMKIIKGQIFDESDMNAGNRIIITANRKDLFGDYGEPVPVNEVRELRNNLNDENPRIVIGIAEKQKRQYFDPYTSAVFHPFKKGDYNLNRNEIVVRVNPAADNDFAGRFKEEMKEQLSLGPYFLSSVMSMVDRRDMLTKRSVGDNIKSVLAITAFLVINIFLVIIGTFWSRTETRRSEVGLRIALGSSKQKVRWQMFLETFIMLFISSIVGLYICINLGQSEILQSLGIPLADYEQAGFGSEQDIINYFITFIFLTIVSGLAVWYPAKLASDIYPAEALRAE